jgi:hypothetical protein
MTLRGTGKKIAVVWRGDRQARIDATPANNRFYRVFEALAFAGIEAEPAVYAEEMADEVREQLLKADGVLVWVDPLSGGRNRVALDTMLRDVASQGVWVSAHPDVTLKMGVKEVLHPRSNWVGERTRISIVPRVRLAKSSRRDFNRTDHVLLSRTAATEAMAFGKSRARLPSPLVFERSAYWKRDGAACRRSSLSRISSDAARHISALKGVSSINRFSRCCRMG